MSGPTTRIGASTADDVTIRGRSVPHAMLGRTTFTEAIVWHWLGRDPSPAEREMLDACLVALMEHGLTPTVIATRLTYTSAPEAMQGAVAAGLLSVGSRYVGTMEGCAELLVRIAAATDRDAEAAAIARERRAERAPVPGLGHPQHRPEDPRSVRLFAMAEANGTAGAHVDAVRALSRAVDAAAGRHLPINATGAIAAILCDCGFPPELLRGVALVARCAGLVGHIREEQLDPAMHALWDGASAAVPYEYHPDPSEEEAP